MKVFIEQTTEKNKKYIFDKKTGRHLKTIFINVTYPFPYGHIFNTIADDGENLDCYVVTNRKLGAGAIVACEPVGLVEWFEDGKEDHKILAVLQGEGYEISEDVQNKIADFAKHFFDDQPDKNYRLGKFYGKDHAIGLIKRSTN